MFGALALPIIDIIGKVLDKAIPDAETRERAKAEITAQLLANDKVLTEAARDVVVAEAKGESWLQRNWRPMLMVAIMGLLLWNGMVLPILSAMTGVDLAKLQAWDSMPSAMWSLLQIGVGGYVIGRTGEKIADAVVATSKGGAR